MERHYWSEIRGAATAPAEEEKGSGDTKSPLRAPWMARPRWQARDRGQRRFLLLIATT